MVIRQEYPNIRVKSIDLDTLEHSGDHESAVSLAIGEFLDPDSSLFVAYRNAQRWVQIYEPTSPSPRPSPHGWGAGDGEGSRRIVLPRGRSLSDHRWPW